MGKTKLLTLGLVGSAVLFTGIGTSGVFAAEEVETTQRAAVEQRLHDGTGERPEWAGTKGEGNGTRLEDGTGMGQGMRNGDGEHGASFIDADGNGECDNQI